MTELHLRTVGLAAVQDLGRPGLAHLGIAENGAADGEAARVANLLAGNGADAPLIEVTGSAFSFTADVDLLVAVTGPGTHILVDGVRQPAWETLVVRAGAVAALEAPDHGLRRYVAVNGRLNVPSTLGSVAPDRLLGTGHALRSGDRLTVRSNFAGLHHPHLGIPVFRMGARPTRRRGPLVVDVTQGPDAYEFPELVERGLTAAYEVSIESDAIGLRLLGPTPHRSTGAEILSRGVPVGAIEVPPAGGLLLLLRGRFVTAGYPVVAVATRAGVDRLGQARPGDTVGFNQVGVAQARSAHRQRVRELELLAARVRAALTAVGLGAVMSESRNQVTHRAA